ncbi:MAG TPA: hypothetical protein VFE16_08500 [Candidatus Cybelea sp.]|nr:hypothetical protein [Candidatus Cybelea sp.]
MKKSSTNRIVACIALATTVAGAAFVPGAASAAPIDQLNRLVGTWQSTGTFVDTPYQKAGTATATTTCAWSNDHGFMICQQSVMMNGTPDSDLGIYTYDPTANVYRFDNVHASRTTSSTILVDDKSITYPFSFTDNGKSVVIRTLNVWQSASAYTWRTEFSTDNGATWTLMGSGKSEKQ